MSYSYLLKYIIIGDQSVGKSCILMRFIDNQFKMGSEPTIGVEFGSKTIKVHNKVVKLQIWDTVNMERTRPARKPTNQSPAPTTGAPSEQSSSMTSPPSPPSTTPPSGSRRPRTSPPTRTSKWCSSETKAIRIMNDKCLSIRPSTSPRRIRSPSSRAQPRQDLTQRMPSSCSRRRQLRRQNQAQSTCLTTMGESSWGNMNPLACRSEGRPPAADVIQFYASQKAFRANY